MHTTVNAEDNHVGQSTSVRVRLSGSCERISSGASPFSLAQQDTTRGPPGDSGCSIAGECLNRTPPGVETGRALSHCRPSRSSTADPKRLPRLYFFHQSEILPLLRPSTSLRQRPSGVHGSLAAPYRPNTSGSSLPSFIPAESQETSYEAVRTKGLDKQAAASDGVYPHMSVPVTHTNSEAPVRERGPCRLVDDPVLAQTLSILARARQRPMKPHDAELAKEKTRLPEGEGLRTRRGTSHPGLSYDTMQTRSERLAAPLSFVSPVGLSNVDGRSDTTAAQRPTWRVSDRPLDSLLEGKTGRVGASGGAYQEFSRAYKWCRPAAAHPLRRRSTETEPLPDGEPQQQVGRSDRLRRTVPHSSAESLGDRPPRRVDETEDDAGLANQTSSEGSILVQKMPRGRHVVLNFLSNWGDNQEIGIAGIELFDDEGQSILLDKSGVWPLPSTPSATTTTQPPQPTNAPDLSQQQMEIDALRQVVRLRTTASAGELQILAEYAASGEELLASRSQEAMQALARHPRRRLTNVVHAPYITHDEHAMFAIPYTPGHAHLLCLMFSRPRTLSLIRIYNYSGKGRVHTFKGVREVELRIDDVLVFHGEVAQNSGEWVTDPTRRGIANCENLLFTRDLPLLRCILGPGVDGDANSHASTQSGRTSRASQSPSRRNTMQSEHSTTGADVLPKGRTIVFRRRSDPVQNYVGGQSPMAVLPHGGRRPCPTPPSANRPTVVLSEGPARGSFVPPRTRAHPCVRGRLPPFDAATLSPPLALGPRQECLRKPPGLCRAWAAGDRDPRTPSTYPSQCPRDVRSACVMFLSNWGDPEKVGLSGMRLRDAHGSRLGTSVCVAGVVYPDGSHASGVEQEALICQVAHLFDERPDTACVLPFFPGMEVVLEFDPPIETLGFLDVANYSVGAHTYTGAKAVRFFLGLGPSTSSSPPQALATYQQLWTLASSLRSRQALLQARIVEVTPGEGVALRKAPAHFNHTRFQTYDLSLANSGGPAELESAEWGSPADSWCQSANESVEGFPIAVGPGTGGATGPTAMEQPKDAEGLKMRWVPSLGGTGSARGGSLMASMNIRAAIAMRRARMLLGDWPDWLLDYQPYITPLLPVGYVLKVCLTICARTLGDSDVFPSAADSLKAYLKAWMLRPLTACTFVNEDGKILKVDVQQPSLLGAPTENDMCVLDFLKAPKRRTQKYDSLEEDEDTSEYCEMRMVAESLVSTSTTSQAPDGVSGSKQLQVYVELAYVSDTPFCLAVLGLNRPLVLDGAAAWVKNLLLRMDDSLIYDSGDAVLKLARSGLATRSTKLPDTTAHVSLPPCVSSLKPIILFTLETNTLERLRQRVLSEA